MSNDLQRTDDWYEARLGKVTASRVYDVCARTEKGEPYSKYQDYLMELALERITGIPTDTYTSKAMQWGIDTEPEAKEAYALQTMNEVQDIGFVEHPIIENFGASPDGLLLDMFGKPLNKAIEIKCPTSKTHLETLTTGKVNPQYIYQMATQLMCLGMKECVFMSFDPRFPAKLQIFLYDFELTAEMEEEITFKVVEFNSKVAQVVDKLKERMG